MNRIPIADWAAQAPWTGILAKPSWVGTSGPLVDLSQLSWNDVPASRYPVWNGQQFVPTVITTPGSPSDGTTIKDGDQPAFAVRRRPPVNPTGEFEDVWQRFVFNVKLYGATGAGTDDTDAINAAIFDLNTAGMGMLYFPAGTYSCSAPPSIISGFALVKGDGIGVTTLRFSGGNGFTFDPASAGTYFGAEGFAVEQVGTALSVRGGSIQMHELAIQCSELGIDLGTPVSPLASGCLTSSFFLSSGTNATAIRVRGNNIEIAGVQVMANGTTWNRGISLEEGLNAAFHDNYVANCAHEAVFLGPSVSHSRIHDIAFSDIQAVSAVLDTGTSNYVNELFGLGGNTDTRFDARKELYSLFSWAPGTVAPGYGFYDDFTVAGAALGDQCVLGAPYSFYEGVSTDIRVVSTNTVRTTIFNLGTATIDLGPALWKMRIFN